MVRARSIVCALVALASFVTPIATSAAPGGQIESGTVVVPVVGTVGGAIVDSCPSFLGATPSWALGRSVVEHSFSVRASTWGKRFVLTPDLATSDVAIAFRLPPWSWRVRDDLRFGASERGIVPRGAIQAMVCLVVGTPTTFVYRAG